VVVVDCLFVTKTENRALSCYSAAAVFLLLWILSKDNGGGVVRNTQREIPPKTFRRRDGAAPPLTAAQLTRLERDSKDPVPRQTGPAPMSARLSLIHTHTFPYSLCQLIFFFHLFLPLTSSYRFCVPPTQTSLSQHDWLRYVNWGI
jgi:hypothetical protein